MGVEQERRKTMEKEIMAILKELLEKTTLDRIASGSVQEPLPLSLWAPVLPSGKGILEVDLQTL